MNAHRISSMASVLSLALPALLFGAVPWHHRATAATTATATTLTVANDNSQLVNVVMFREGDWYILGAVNPHKVQTFAIPTELVGSTDVTIVTTPTNDRMGFESQPLALSAGQPVDVVVEHTQMVLTLG